jgi:hypothetical protein
MNTLHLTMALAMAVGCTASSDNNIQFYSLTSRAAMFRASAYLLYVQTTGDGVPTTIEHSAVVSNGTAWRATVTAQLFSRGAFRTPTELSVFLKSSETGIESRQTTPFNTAQLHGVSQLERGSRYLLASESGSSVTPSGVYFTGRVFRVTTDGRLAEPALEFPAGTPMSTVMDPSTMPSNLVGDPNGPVWMRDGGVEGG